MNGWNFRCFFHGEITRKSEWKTNKCPKGHTCYSDETKNETWNVEHTKFLLQLELFLSEFSW